MGATAAAQPESMSQPEVHGFPFIPASLTPDAKSRWEYLAAKSGSCVRPARVSQTLTPAPQAQEGL